MHGLSELMGKLKIINFRTVGLSKNKIKKTVNKVKKSINIKSMIIKLEKLINKNLLSK